MVFRVISILQSKMYLLSMLYTIQGRRSLEITDEKECWHMYQIPFMEDDQPEEDGGKGGK